MRTSVVIVVLLISTCLCATTRPLKNITNNGVNVPANVLIPLSGIGAMVGQAVDETAGFDTLVSNLVSQAISDGLLPKPYSTCSGVYGACWTQQDYVAYARMIAHYNARFRAIGPMPKQTATELFFVQGYMKTDVNADGTINWSLVDQDIANIVTRIFSQTGPFFTTIPLVNVQHFFQQTARYLDVYNQG